MTLSIPEDINSRSRLGVATFFRDHGFAVVPFEPSKKKPAIKGWHDLKRGNCDDAFLARWWGNGYIRDLDVMVAEPLIIIDIDGRGDPKVVVDWLQAQAHLADAPFEMTDRGAHVWLNCPDMPMASRDKERIEVFLAGGIKAELFVKGRAVRTTPSGPASGGSYSFAQTGPVPEVAWSMLQQIFWIEAGGKKTAGRLEGNALGHQLEDICAHACRGDADAVETATAVAWSALGISLPTNSNFTPARA